MMYIPPQLQQHIQSCVDDLDQLVNGQGCSLVDPEVVRKSMELDELILLAMKRQKEERKASSRCAS
ncbi:aspartyl-phosphate phosphatase Spo0E family protein [Paenibacillus silviterrae]|uniref:aspartyl-phosphate phosphatase Spo0E family protein n=1 Tax=Paenibacillus silviterrae TaxID=3242194 RepID=UPI0025433AE1|nr:aspartyl-phosphate phosphatase Spo0E family protein [Paenibacillus chinjuensis]